MTFAMLIEKISDEYSIDILSKGSDFEIQDVALIDNKHDDALQSTLYFGYDNQLNSPTSVPAQCIIAGTDYSLPDFSNICNIAVVAKDSLFPIFNDIKALIQANFGKGFFEELTSLADKTHNIETIIDTASIRLGNSLLFCDMNFKIISCSSTIPILDPLWVENIDRGYCGYEFRSEVKELQSVKNASQSTTAIEVTCPKSPYRKFSSKVFHNQMQVGFLLMIEGESHILPPHLEMLSDISQVISYTIAYYTPDLLEENSLYHEVLYDMLIGAPFKDIVPKLSKLHFPSKMRVIFIHPTRYLGQQYLKNFVYKHLKVRIPGSHVTYHNKGIVAVIPLQSDSETACDQQEMLDDFCQQEHIQIGISNSFTNIENFVNYSDQAHAALELAQKLKTEELVCHYQDYQIFDLFSEVNHPDKLGRFCHPALSTLRQYDHKNNAQLYKTLCVFIDKKCNIKLTSESLFIHRNSLVYRLTRITDICQLDFSDTNTLFLLRLSFLIDRYNELNTSAEWQ